MCRGLRRWGEDLWIMSLILMSDTQVARLWTSMAVTVVDRLPTRLCRLMPGRCPKIVGFGVPWPPKHEMAPRKELVYWDSQAPACCARKGPDQYGELSPFDQRRAVWQWLHTCPNRAKFPTKSQQQHVWRGWNSDCTSPHDCLSLCSANVRTNDN